MGLTVEEGYLSSLDQPLVEVVDRSLVPLAGLQRALRWRGPGGPEEPSATEVSAAVLDVIVNGVPPVARQEGVRVTGRAALEPP